MTPSYSDNCHGPHMCPGCLDLSGGAEMAMLLVIVTWAVRTTLHSHGHLGSQGSSHHQGKGYSCGERDRKATERPGLQGGGPAEEPDSSGKAVDALLSKAGPS
jgi:hypothetical protein